MPPDRVKTASLRKFTPLSGPQTPGSNSVAHSIENAFSDTLASSPSTIPTDLFEATSDLQGPFVSSSFIEDLYDEFTCISYATNECESTELGDLTAQETAVHVNNPPEELPDDVAEMIELLAQPPVPGVLPPGIVLVHTELGPVPLVASDIQKTVVPDNEVVVGPKNKENRRKRELRKRKRKEYWANMEAERLKDEGLKLNDIPPQ
ncbi:hypothetical protein QCA50_014423 [Cerrena zonata]|uniref:BZIP domain-containing protein n=1 Tax=Cerrena zonata TaxID=2478898 RepID=A0AAW0FYD6_9APHY